ncbi:MAG: metal ABC transporter permease [Anaerolineae bacterium]|nr:metal ABC transporter permease [Anaerolineae bacterium]
MSTLPLWINWLIEPFTYSFMQRGLLAAVMVSVICAVLGAFVVLRGMAFVGDAMAHTILPGIVIAYWLGGNLLLGALAAGLLTAFGIGWFTRDGQLQEDTAIGVMFSGLFALGILLLSIVSSYRDLTHILFGNILGVSGTDLWLIAGVGVLVVGMVLAFFKELVVTSFDPGHAITIGLSPGVVRYGLLILLAFATVSGIQSVGVVMVVSLLVTPAATAYLLSQQLPRMILMSVGFSVGAALVGLYLSYYWNLASGATIVLALTTLFIIVFLIAPRRGLLWRMRAKHTSTGGTDERNETGREDLLLSE